MKTKKMNLNEIKGVLSRDEMRKIMAGSGSNGCPTKACTADTDCDGFCDYCISGNCNQKN